MESMGRARAPTLKLWRKRPKPFSPLPCYGQDGGAGEGKAWRDP